MEIKKRKREAKGKPTDEVSRTPIPRGMQQRHQPTAIPDSLLKPRNLLPLPTPFVLLQPLVLLPPIFLILLTHREDEQQGRRRARDEGEERGVGEREDVVDGECW